VWGCPMRSPSPRFLRFGLEGNIQSSAMRQWYGPTINTNKTVFNPNFSKQGVRLTYRNFNFGWLVIKGRLHNFRHYCGNCLPRCIPLPYKLLVMLKSSLFFPGDEFAHFVQQRGELVVVRFFLNTNAQAIHALALF